MGGSRQTILSRLRKAAAVPSDLPETPEGLGDKIAGEINSITPVGTEELIRQFQDELEEVSGEFNRIKDVKRSIEIIERIMKERGYTRIAFTGEARCRQIAAGLKQYNSELSVIDVLEMNYPDRKTRVAEIPIALVEASFAVADTGSLAFLYDDTGTSLPHFLADCIVTVVAKENLTANHFELFKKIPPSKMKNMVFVSGPSRTADIEKVLILGAHGPRRLIVLMFD